MDTTVVALGDSRVQVAVGRAGENPSVSVLHSALAPATGESWLPVLEELWRGRGLARKNVWLVLPDEEVTSRVISAPDLPDKQLEELVDHEMQSREEEPVIADFTPIGRDAEGHLSLFCSACRTGVLEGYLDLFRNLGVRLAGVSVPLAGHLKLLRASREMADQTCIWLCFEESSVLSILVVNGEYRYSGYSRVFSEPGTVDFATEITRNVSGTLQFHSADRSEYAIQTVYYAGCSDDDFAVCTPELENLGLSAQPLPNCPRFRAAPEGVRLSDWLDCVGALLR